MLLISVGRAEEYAIALDVGERNRLVVGRQDEQPGHGRLAVLASQGGDGGDAELVLLRLMANDRFFADDEVGLALRFLFECVGQRFVEVEFRLAVELLFEVLDELLVIALGVTLDAGARQRRRERVHDDQRERRLVLGRGDGRDQDEGKCGDGRSHSGILIAACGFALTRRLASAKPQTSTSYLLVFLLNTRMRDAVRSRK